MAPGDKLVLCPPRPNIDPMTDDNGDAFQPHLGRLGTDSSASTFKHRVMRAVGRAGGDPRRAASKTSGGGGRFNVRGRGAKIAATLPREMGWTFDRNAGMRVRPRRVIAKMRIVKICQLQSRAARTHLRYLRREGITFDGERQIYTALEDAADTVSFLDRGRDDRHQFRLIISPEDGAEVGSLRDFTRRLMVQVERDLETTLDWVAIDHYNTGHPHTHVVIRGVTDQDKILYIASDYITHGIRHRAREIVTLELGPQTERELQRGVRREIGQDRLTQLDRILLEDATPDGLVDLRTMAHARYSRQLLIGRLQKLERMGLARVKAPSRWLLAANMERTLRHLGEDADINETMRQTIAERGLMRHRYAIHHAPEPGMRVVGRVLSKGVTGRERYDKAHLLIDGIDGQVHYVEMAQFAAGAVQTDHIVEINRPHRIERYVAPLENRPPLAPDVGAVRGQGDNNDVHASTHGFERGCQDGLARVNAEIGRRGAGRAALEARVLSVIDIEAQITAHAATWLDRTLVADTDARVADSGFGRELRRALMRRQEWLIEQGLARREGNTVVFGRDLLATLSDREVLGTGRPLARARGLALRVLENGERISGQYRETLTLVSGPYAVIETASDLALLPCRGTIEKAQGRRVSGLVVDDEVDWHVGRRRGIGRGI
jgi:type IV secretory pathway VirD2 relaxase